MPNLISSSDKKHLLLLLTRHPLNINHIVDILSIPEGVTALTGHSHRTTERLEPDAEMKRDLRRSSDVPWGWLGCENKVRSEKPVLCSRTHLRSEKPILCPWTPPER
ncbi:hypothetical protein NHX12_022081 [Muraenolepis orangiensis]|uniref:Uncharacterized protein n=1 Tax=Muraenolepis orangiensis TaxID=630683 RepID=A0A9Q0IR11_9TELE|nr:hypothetical protein NHX12_022081 [Muraenolepis orangiensis]